MATVIAIMELGGWSDAIHWDAMPPRLSITPLGDVHAITSFHSNIVRPFSAKGSSHRIELAMQDYEKSFRPAEVYESDELVADSDFIEAWKHEFGFEIDNIRRFVDAIEDAGIQRKTIVLRLTKSELSAILLDRGCVDNVDAMVSTLSLVPRTSWRDVPDGFDAKDLQPWRFRRQLSTIRRPMIQLYSGSDPEYLVAPGLLRESFGYLLENYYERGFPDRHYKSTAMRNWHDQRLSRRGSSFVQTVAERINKCGWKTAPIEMDVTEILKLSEDPDFGDVRRFGDVDVLAWNETFGRILIIECKRLHYHKAASEIAEQLSDYRGKTKRNRKPDDLLRHLNRIEILKSRRATVCKRIGVPDGFTIEGWIVFSNPVPMLYAWESLKIQVRFTTFDDIERDLQTLTSLIEHV